MTVKECYEAMGGDYDDVVSRLRTDERIAKFLLKIADDKSYALLLDSLEAKNMEEAFRAAHTLKGVCMNLSIKRLYGSAEQLTEALRGRHEYDSSLEPLLEKVKEDYAVTIDCIKRLS